MAAPVLEAHPVARTGPLRMVATVLGLRLRITVHQLRREWWRVLLVVGGAIWSLSLVPITLGASTILSYNNAALKADATVAVAAVLTIGWILVPLVVTGLDDSLDPARFAPWGIEPRRLMPALSISTLLTVPSLFTLFVLVALAASWRTEYPRPGTLVVALLGAVVTWVSIVWGARLATAWSARLLNSRRSRQGMAAMAVLLLALIVPTIWVVARDGLELVLEYDVPLLLDQLGRTPIAAGIAAPELVAYRDPPQALWRLVMMVGWLLLLHSAWRASVAHALVHPVFRGGGTKARDDAVLATAEAAQSRRGYGRHVAVRARLVRAWSGDPRHVSGGVGALVMPVAALVLVPLFGADPRWMFVAPLVLAATIGWGRHNDVALDSSALWLDIASGRLGTAVMRGRMEAVVRWALPAVVLLSLVAVTWTREWLLAPGLLGAGIGVLGATLGVAALTSVVFPYRAPAPGESPFGAQPGSVGAGLVAQTLSSLATVVVLPLAVVPFALAVLVDPRWAWVSAVLGVGVGVGVYVVGIRAAGIVYDRRSGSLLGAVS